MKTNSISVSFGEMKYPLSCHSAKQHFCVVWGEMKIFCFLSQCFAKTKSAPNGFFSVRQKFVKIQILEVGAHTHPHIAARWVMNDDIVRGICTRGKRIRGAIVGVLMGMSNEF
jgi:hypothetical protein